MGIQLSKGGAVHLEVVTPESKTLCGRDSSNGEATDDNVSCKSCLNVVAKSHVKAEMAQETEASVERNRRIVARATAETLHVQTEEPVPVATCDVCGKTATLHVLYNDGREGYLCEDVASECRADMADDLFYVDTITPRSIGNFGDVDWEFAVAELRDRIEAESRVITHNCATCGPNATAQCAWCYRVAKTAAPMSPRPRVRLCKHKGSKIDRRRSNSRIGRGVRA